MGDHMPQQKALEVVRIEDEAYRIEDNGMVRSYLFVGGRKALLVDSTNGTGGSLRAVVRGITDKPVMLVNTHADPDHIAMNHEFDVAWMHPAEMPHYAQMRQQAGAATATCPAAALWEGEVIDIGGRAFEVVLVCGHTPGSIALLDRARRVIVTGDLLATVPVFMFGMWRSLDAYRAALLKLQDMRDAFDVVYPSHGDYPLDPSVIDAHLAAADALAQDRLQATKPPFPLPAMLYEGQGASFFYEQQD